jgi:hypothetical protein
MGYPKNPEGYPSIEVLRERVETNYLLGDSGCWLWQGYVNDSGYGVLKIRPYRIRAHRASFEVFSGPVPDGLVLDHLCRVRHCVNPEHLEPVTEQVNILSGLEALAVENEEVAWIALQSTNGGLGLVEV